MSDPDEVLTNLLEKEVYSSNGRYVGRVVDAQMDYDKKEMAGLALEDANPELFGDALLSAEGVLVPRRLVRNVGDIIIVAEVVEQYAEAVSQGSAQPQTKNVDDSPAEAAE